MHTAVVIRTFVDAYEWTDMCHRGTENVLRRRTTAVGDDKRAYRRRRNGNKVAGAARISNDRWDARAVSSMIFDRRRHTCCRPSSGNSGW